MPRPAARTRPSMPKLTRVRVRARVRVIEY